MPYISFSIGELRPVNKTMWVVFDEGYDFLDPRTEMLILDEVI